MVQLLSCSIPVYCSLEPLGTSFLKYLTTFKHMNVGLTFLVLTEEPCRPTPCLQPRHWKMLLLMSVLTVRNTEMNHV